MKRSIASSFLILSLGGASAGEDRAQGGLLLAQAATGGQPAAAATSLAGQRQQRQADINYWTTTYDGADLVAGNFNCVAPNFPAYSETKSKIKELAAASDAYVACYNGFIANLEAAMPPGKRIPEDVARLMNEQELGQARANLAKVYDAVAARGNLAADQMIARRDAWLKQTSDYVTTQNKRRDQQVVDLERNNEISRQVRNDTIRIPSYPNVQPPPGR